MAVLVRILRSDNPVHDTTGDTEAYSKELDDLIGVSSANAASKIIINNVWDPSSDSWITIVVRNSNTGGEE
jgi:hypothetical protein|tara:strand:+ start:926 stop:1138 length:213 start_codon:yes stop_codon:yes gene_type:complete